MSLQCDVSKKEEVEKLMEATVKEFGRIDILVNNAGIVQFQSFLDLSEQDWDKTLDVNLKGYFLRGQAAAREMTKQKKRSDSEYRFCGYGSSWLRFSGHCSLLRQQGRHCGYG